MMKPLLADSEVLYDGINGEKYIAKQYYQELEDEDFYPHSDGFIGAMALQIIERMDLKSSDRFVDLRGGRGAFAKAISDRVKFDAPMLIVDSREKMIAHIQEHYPDIETLNIDAQSFAKKDAVYDKILIKEVIDQFDDAEELLANLYDRLAPGGILFLIHTPPILKKPLFKAALEKAKEKATHAESLKSILERSGFSVKKETFAYPQVIPKEYYLEMVETRYTSVLRAFSKEEIQYGLAEIKKKYKDQDILRFDDYFDYLIAKKP